jgi:hypothetical protein
MFGLAFWNAATLAMNRSWLAFSVAGGRPLMTRVTGPSLTLVESPPSLSLPQAAVETLRPAASNRPRAPRSLDLNMGCLPLCAPLLSCFVAMTIQRQTKRRNN